MQNLVTVFDFSGIYDHESFYLEDKGSFNVVNVRDIQGTNCMCDSMAVSAIEDLILQKGIPADAIHFIDSGNYHYMSYILTGKVTMPFSLLVIFLITINMIKPIRHHSDSYKNVG